ncbi:MAG: hypothetical protein ACYTXE_27780 [Nostoc sp.]|jgi:hypothetical protein
MNKAIRIFLGILAFSLLSSMVNKLFFEKSSEQKAKETCKNMLEAVGAHQVGITVTVDSKTYNCN